MLRILYLVCYLSSNLEGFNFKVSNIQPSKLANSTTWLQWQVQINTIRVALDFGLYCDIFIVGLLILSLFFSNEVRFEQLTSSSIVDKIY